MERDNKKMRNTSGEEIINKLKIGEFSATYFTILLILLAIFGASIYSWIRIIEQGHILANIRNIGTGGVTWGIFVVFIIYFIGISAGGISIYLIRLFRIKELQPLSRSAELLTIISLICGALCILMDQGRVVHALFNLPRYARVASPFFGTFTFAISGYLFPSLVYLFLSVRADAFYMSQRAKGILRIFYKILASGFKGEKDDLARHSTSTFYLAIFTLPLLVIACSTLGFVLGIQGGRPGWFSTLRAPGFVIMALISGIGLLSLIAYIFKKVYKIDSISESTFSTLGFFLMVLLITYLYFMIIEELTANYAAPQKDREVAHEVVIGTYAITFWITVATLFIPFAMLFYFFVIVRKKPPVPVVVISGVLVNIAVILKRFLIVVPSQTVGMFLDFPEGSYIPAFFSEILPILGLISFTIAVFLIFAKVFPIVPVVEHLEEVEREEMKFSRFIRRIATFTTLGIGLFLMSLGFLASARLWTEPYSDPVIPFAPVIFILGVILSFSSAIVYEMLPRIGGRK